MIAPHPPNCNYDLTKHSPCKMDRLSTQFTIEKKRFFSLTTGEISYSSLSTLCFRLEALFLGMLSIRNFVIGNFVIWNSVIIMNIGIRNSIAAPAVPTFQLKTFFKSILYLI
jgi:hypothetical protein